MKGKLKFVLPLVALIVLGGAYKTVLAKPAPKAKHKVEGQVYVLPRSSCSTSPTTATRS
jgi:hypothetical protein